MAEGRFPSDFDWVTARSQCSAFNMFGLLGLEARRNVDKLEEIAKGEGKSVGVRFHQAEGRLFSVVRSTYMGEVGVRFILNDDRILVEGTGVNVRVSATLTLNNAGECRLVIDGEELDRWQVLRRALEPVLFWSSE